VSERYGNCYYHLMIFNVAFHNNAFQKTAKAWRKKAILRNGLYNLRIVLAFFQKYIGGGEVNRTEFHEICAQFAHWPA
jgi:hypothetical protein